MWDNEILMRGHAVADLNPDLFLRGKYKIICGYIYFKINIEILNWNECRSCI